VTVPGVTTRPHRADDAPGAYEYLTREQLDAEEGASGLLLRSTYGAYAYGIRRSAVEGLLASSQTPMLTITPESALRLVVHDRSAAWRAVFLDADDVVLDRRLAGRGAPPDSRDRQQRAEDRKYSRRPWSP
jgi:guanylate kinase